MAELTPVYSPALNCRRLLRPDRVPREAGGGPDPGHRPHLLGRGAGHGPDALGTPERAAMTAGHWDSPTMPARYTKAQAGVRKIHEHSQQARRHQAGERRTLAPGSGYVQDPEGDPGERVRRDRSGHRRRQQRRPGVPRGVETLLRVTGGPALAMVTASRMNNSTKKHKATGKYSAILRN